MEFFESPLPRSGGIDLNKPRIRATLATVLALAAASARFTVTDLATKVHTMTGHTDYTTRQAAYDLRKLRGKDLMVKPGRSRRCHLSAQPARTITALLILREQVIAPILAGVRSPPNGPQTRHLDPRRSRLRSPPYQHAIPLPPPRHHHRSRRGIDNFLSIEVS